MNSILIAKKSRESVLTMTSESKSSHVGSALSVIDILAVLYSEQVSPRFPYEIILSKGHASSALYSVLFHKGFLQEELLHTYAKNGAEIGGHVNASEILGIPLSTGSLGHGFPFGIGLALANKKVNSVNRVVVIISDGECNEGTTWESALIAAQNNLDNLIIFIDRNRMQSLGETETILSLEPLAEKWKAFNWNVIEIDGHNHQSILNSLKIRSEGKPLVVIANTIKGKGVKFMENDNLWHYRPPTREELILALREVNAN